MIFPFRNLLNLVYYIIDDKVIDAILVLGELLFGRKDLKGTTAILFWQLIKLIIDKDNKQ